MIVEKKRLNKIFRNIKDMPIAVVGDVMLDRYLWGNAERISPEAPVPVVYVERETARPGGASNVAWNIAAIGAKPLLFGVIGDDMFAQILQELLDEYKIAPDYLVTDDKRPTTAKTRIIARGQQMLRIDRENIIDIHREVEDQIIESIIDSLDKVSALVISDYGKGTISRRVLKKIIPIARKKKVFIAIDPKENHFGLYGGATIVTPNTKEAGDAVGIKIKDKATLLRAGQKLKKLTGAENILITRGSEGMSLFYMDDSMENFPTMARQVYDVTGAGDTIVGICAAVAAGGGTLREAAIISSHAAGVVVRKVGTAVAHSSEIAKSIEVERIKKEK